MTLFKEADAIPTLDYMWQESPYGPALLGFYEDRMCYLGFSFRSKEEMWQDLQSLFKNIPLQNNPNLPSLPFNLASELKLLLIGTPFQRQVWKGLMKIPAGKTMSYAQFAHSLQRPTATRAIAHAISRNPITLFIPCHRVIHTNGKLGGFRMGVDMKKKLLEQEDQEYGTNAHT